MSPTKHFLAIVIGALSFGVAIIMLLAPIFIETVPHSTTRDIIAASLAGFGFVCILPANVEKAASIFRKTAPWGRRSSDSLEAPLDADRRTMPRGYVRRDVDEEGPSGG